MTLQSELCLCPDISTDGKWSTVDLRNLFDNGGLSSLWNDLVRSGELVSNDADITGNFDKKNNYMNVGNSLSLSSTARWSDFNSK